MNDDGMKMSGETGAAHDDRMREEGRHDQWMVSTLDRVARQVDELHRDIRGNGDPSKGALWRLGSIEKWVEEREKQEAMRLSEKAATWRHAKRAVIGVVVLAAMTWLLSVAGVDLTPAERQAAAEAVTEAISGGGGGSGGGGEGG